MAEKACFEGKLRLWKWHLYSVKLANFTFDVCNHHLRCLKNSCFEAVISAFSIVQEKSLQDFVQPAECAFVKIFAGRHKLSL